MNLSETATKLYEFLKQSNGAWIDNCAKHIFQKPEYDTSDNFNYWQWEANMYGYVQKYRPVHKDGQEQMQDIYPSETVSYYKRISDAYQELRNQGLANEKNNGFNEYWIYVIK